MTGDPEGKESAGIEDRRAQLARWVDRNHEDFRRMVRSKVAPLCRAMRDPDQVADELLPEAATALLQSADRYDVSRPEKFWAMGIANNVVRRWQERMIQEQVRRPDSFAARDTYDEEPADVFDRLSLAARDDVEGAVVGASWVTTALAECSERDRKVVQLVVIEDRSAEEVGTILGLKPGAVRTCLSRALERLRARLPEEERTFSGRFYRAEGGVA